MQLERQLEKVMLAKEAAANESNKNFGDRI